MNAEQIAQMRAKARQSSGDFIALNEPGEWFAGVFVEHQDAVTSFGEVVEAVIRNPTVNGVERQGDLTFRLSRSVLARELGPEAEEPPKPGDALFVEYQGERTGKSGRTYHAYAISKEPGTLPPAPEPAPVVGAGGGGDPDADIPFAASQV